MEDPQSVAANLIPTAEYVQSYIPPVCLGIGTTEDFIGALQSDAFTLVTLDALDIRGEEVVAQTTSSGTFETQAFRVSVANASNTITGGDNSFDEAWVPIHETLTYYQGGTEMVFTTTGCGDVASVHEEGSLSSRVRSMSGGRIALLIEMTDVHGPIVRGAAVWDGHNIRTSDGSLTTTQALEETRRGGPPPESELVPEWFEASR